MPHSDIRGSQLADSSSRLNAAYHVLHRLLAPRHPPYTLPSSALHAFRALAKPAGSDQYPCCSHPMPLDCSQASMGSMSITLQLLRCSREPLLPVPGQTKTAWLLPDRSLLTANAFPGQGPRCSPYSERVCSGCSRAVLRQQFFIPHPLPDCNQPVHPRVTDFCLSPKTGYGGGRSWARTRDLSLIRTAL